MAREHFCRETMTLVQENGMRPGYDCRCSGCMAFVTEGGQYTPKARPPERTLFESVATPGGFLPGWGMASTED